MPWSLHLRFENLSRSLVDGPQRRLCSVVLLKQEQGLLVDLANFLARENTFGLWPLTSRLGRQVGTTTPTHLPPRRQHGDNPTSNAFLKANWQRITQSMSTTRLRGRSLPRDTLGHKALRGGGIEAALTSPLWLRGTQPPSTNSQSDTNRVRN